MKIKRYPLPHFNERPSDTVIDTIVIHSMYAKGYPDNTQILNCIEVLDKNKVSAHYSIDRRGTIWQHVEENARAWHAGKSCLPAINDKPEREDVNNFSIGIEVIGVYAERFKKSQYRALNQLVSEIMLRYPIKVIVSHSAIAPGRKTDPGPSFSWNKIKKTLLKKPVRIIP